MENNRSPFSESPQREPASPADGLMPETRWSLVRRVQTDGEDRQIAALGELLGAYWQPLYAYARRRGESPADAEDIVQGFCQMLIARGSMQIVDPERGKLRSFLLSALERYMIDQWEKRTVSKRGGGKRILSLENEEAENRFLREMSHSVTPEREYDRQWVMALLARAMTAIQEDYQSRGKGDVFAALKGALEWHGNDTAYAEAGAALGLNENAVKQAVFRMRKKYRECLRNEVAKTLTDPESVDAELKDLLQILGEV